MKMVIQLRTGFTLARSRDIEVDNEWMTKNYKYNLFNIKKSCKYSLQKISSQLFCIVYIWSGAGLEALYLRFSKLIFLIKCRMLFNMDDIKAAVSNFIIIMYRIDRMSKIIVRIITHVIKTARKLTINRCAYRLPCQCCYRRNDKYRGLAQKNGPAFATWECFVPMRSVVSAYMCFNTSSETFEHKEA